MLRKEEEERVREEEEREEGGAGREEEGMAEKVETGRGRVGKDGLVEKK